MCGIAGVVSWTDRKPVTRELLVRMSAGIAHRGPDGEGYHVSVGSRGAACGLAFRRLAILDPTSRSNQPFVGEDGRYAMVYNGELYNFHEVKSQLSALADAPKWKTTGDTEVVFHALIRWGEKAVARFNGMFAVAFWDRQEEMLLVGRDRMGQKPFYYVHADDGFAFASELAALAPWMSDRTIDRAALWDVLAYGCSTGERTIYQSVRKLSPSTVGVVTRDRARFERVSGAMLDAAGDGSLSYQRITPRATSISRRIAETRDLVREAVRRQMVSDVPLGCYLSGGVDSSIIAASMKASAGAGQKVMTFSIGFDDPRYDESGYAAEVARHLGTTHHTFRVRPDVASDLQKLASVFGEPFADSSALPAHYLARETRKHVTVALSGDGGDELFGGYDRYRAMRLGNTLQHCPTALRRAISGTLAMISGAHPKSMLVRMRRLLDSLERAPAERYAGYLRIFDDAQISSLLADPINHIDPVTLAYAAALTNGDVVTAALATDRQTYLPDDLLTKADRTSMLHGLEVRSPFMDPDVVDFSETLTTEELLAGGPKRLLREAFASELPPSVFLRRKMGFAVPIGQWFRGPLRGMLHDHLFASHSFAFGHFRMDAVRKLVDEHERRSADHSQRLYALLMIELWWAGR